MKQKKITPRILRRIMNIWPPYLGAGIRVRHISDDFSEVIVDLKLRWYNKNYIGTHFGGSLFAMIDPFYMLMILNTLGNDYIVWDKSGSIEFVKPGRGTVTAHFKLTANIIENIKKETQNCDKFVIDLPVDIINENNEIVAKANKQIYIRFKKRICNDE